MNYEMNKQELEELRENIRAVREALNNGGTIRLKPQSWWFSVLSLIAGILIGILGKDYQVMGRIVRIEHAIEAKMSDQWTGMMMSVYTAQLGKRNPTLDIPDVEEIKKTVPVPKP